VRSSVNLEYLWLNYQLCSEFDVLVLNTSHTEAVERAGAGWCSCALPISANPHCGSIKMTSDLPAASVCSASRRNEARSDAPEDLKQINQFCSPQDQIQWGILFLSRYLRGLSPWEREECLQDEWEWARQQGDLLWLQIVRDYRECLKESGPTYRRHQDWFLSNWENPEFRVELQKRLPGSASERTTESVRGKLHKERNRHCGFDGFADPL
jgi:hypothetical protein